MSFCPSSVTWYLSYPSSTYWRRPRPRKVFPCDSTTVSLLLRLTLGPSLGLALESTFLLATPRGHICSLLAVPSLGTLNPREGLEYSRNTKDEPIVQSTLPLFSYQPGILLTHCLRHSILIPWFGPF